MKYAGDKWGQGNRIPGHCLHAGLQTLIATMSVGLQSSFDIPHCAIQNERAQTQTHRRKVPPVVLVPLDHLAPVSERDVLARARMLCPVLIVMSALCPYTSLFCSDSLCHLFLVASLNRYNGHSLTGLLTLT